MWNMIPSFSMEWQLFSEMEPWEVPMLLCCCGALTFFVLLGPHVHQIIITCSCCHYLHMTWHRCSWSCEIQPSHHFQWNDNHLVKWKRSNVPPHVLLLLLIITCLCCNYLQMTWHRCMWLCEIRLSHHFIGMKTNLFSKMKPWTI
jgi:hypothetical protein